MKRKDIFKVSQQLFDAAIRIEKTIWILGCSAMANDELCEAIEDDEEVAALLGIPEDVVAGCTDDREEMAAYLYRQKKHGFLVQAVTPIPDYIDRKSYRASWGCMRQAWFYTDALDADFVQRLVEWREDIHRDAKAKLKEGV
jgi:hypothetical protein